MQDQNPQISVILPTHNRADLLMRAVASVLGQTHTDLELIVIENACTDHTSAVLDRIPDPRLHRLKLDRKSGASAARNAGLAVARGQLIAFQDDDDIWLADKLQRQLQALDAAGESAALCLCGYIGLTANGVYARYAHEHFEQADFNLGFAFRDWSLVATPGWLARRSHLDRAGLFDETLPARNDWELALRLSDSGRLVFVDAPLYVQDQTRTTTMRNNETAFGEAIRRIEALHGHRWAHNRIVQATHAWIVGKAEMLQGDPAQGRVWIARSLRCRPLQLRPWALLIASFLGVARLRTLVNLKQRRDQGQLRRSR